MTKAKQIKKNLGISPERLAELRRVTLTLLPDHSVFLVLKSLTSKSSTF